MASPGMMVGEIIQRIQIHVQPRRVRMREFFYDYDPLRCGRVTAAQFHRALATINFGELKTEEAELLAEYFTDHGPRVEKPQVVNYYKFCDIVEECDVEGNPDPFNSASSPGNTMMSTFRPLRVTPPFPTDHPRRPCFTTSAVSSQSTQGPVSSRPASSSGSLEPPPPRKRMGTQLVKTQLCKHYLRGYCRYKEKCTFAHLAEELVPRPDLQKTKMCVSFLSGCCSNLNCQFAHGLQELRPMSSSHDGCDVGSTSSIMEETQSHPTGIAHEQHGRSPLPLWLFGSPALVEDLEGARLTDSAEQRNDYRGGDLMSPSPQADPIAMNESLRQLAILRKQLIAESQIIVEVPEMMVETPATKGWGSLVKAQLREQRKRHCAQGKVLLEGDRRKDPVTFLEEQLLASILLGDCYWRDAFPQLTHRFSTMLATRHLSGFHKDIPEPGCPSALRFSAEGSPLQTDPRRSLNCHPACTKPHGAPIDFLHHSASGLNQSLSITGELVTRTSQPSAERTNFQSGRSMGLSLSTQLNGSSGAFENSGTEILPPSGSRLLAHRQFELRDMATLWMSQDSFCQTSSEGMIETVEATCAYNSIQAVPANSGSVNAVSSMGATIPQARQNIVLGQNERDRLNALLHRLAQSSSHAGAVQQL